MLMLPFCSFYCKEVIALLCYMKAVPEHLTYWAAVAISYNGKSYSG